MRKALTAAALLAAVLPQTAFPAQPAFTYYGEIAAFAYKKCPKGWDPAYGYRLHVYNRDGSMLFPLMGRTYTSSDVSPNEFQVPDLREHPPTLPDTSAKDRDKITWCIRTHDAVFPPRAH